MVTNVRYLKGFSTLLFHPLAVVVRYMTNEMLEGMFLSLLALSLCECGILQRFAIPKEFILCRPTQSLLYLTNDIVKKV